MSKEARYTIGIDLGTSNCAVAFAEFGPGAKVHDFGITQVQREGQVGTQLLLPSALYSPTGAEGASGSLSLPWENPSGWVIGQFARWRGARVPGRLITSAKSWLCHPAVDRNAPILPWGGAPDVPKISPVTASALLLEHMRRAWDEQHPSAPMAAQEVAITVPASFDEVARGLTVNAARQAGLEHFTLLEEPQAAFYHFSHLHQKRLAAILENIRLVLVVDVGGGTTDFTLVQAAPSPEGPLLKRIAVGDHLILGGDNMDAALARRNEEKLSGRKLSSAQWIQLVQAAREAKETLLGESAPKEVKIALASEGSKLLGGTISSSLSRDEVETLILEGFFPDTAEAPNRVQRAGIQEMGLPYVADPAITKHLAAFLRKHAENAFEALGKENNGGMPRPDALLFNGGVFNSRKLAERLLRVLSSWWPNRRPVEMLAHDNLDLAVARGAAYYGLVRKGQGRRISGGTGHAYYLGIAAEKDEEQSSAICLVPRGLEEGETVELKERVFKLHVGKPVQFPLYTSTADRVDRAGDVVKLMDDLNALPPLETALKSSKARFERIPVFLRGKLTEIGTIEIWCAAMESSEQWRLEFDVRGQTRDSNVTTTESLPARMDDATQFVGKVYGNKPVTIEGAPKDARQLWASLERVLGPRDSWTLPVLRNLWSELFAGAAKRRRSAEHEKVFFQLIGYALRPGFGYSLDDWRCEQSFKLFPELVEFHKEKPIWNEFWIFWRRVAGGLNAINQQRIWEYLKPHLTIRVPAKSPKNVARPKGIQPEGTDEMVRAAASLEQLPSEEKVWLGELILARVAELKPVGGPWTWALGRLGARVPFYGSTHAVIPPTTAERWIRVLMDQKVEHADFALVQLSRRTGDRLRDIDGRTRASVTEWLRSNQAAEQWITVINELAAMRTSDEARAFGESLPIGLQLAR